ncbi:MAG: putative baseplate assembly protein [Gemmatimonadales bacterium]|nr:MAG: putative baseplate assembly protein [Gemmatimonadales bacterium]
MPLQPPILDDRSFEDLVREARDRIPRFTPEWTNLNDSDPGMTLVKLQAWLAKTVLYRLNRVPELTYLKFLELLNVEPGPARSARSELTFTLKKLKAPGDPLVVIIPRGSQVAVDDPDLDQDVVFETDYSLRAYNAAIGAIIVSSDDETRPHRLVTEYEVDEARSTVLHAFRPFGASPEPGRICLVGLVLRPHATRDRGDLQDTFPDGKLDVTLNATQVFDDDDQGQIIPGPLAAAALFPQEVGERGTTVEWEIYVGTDHLSDFGDVSGDQGRWRRLNLADETAGLTRSGHLRLEVPEGVSAASLYDLDRDFWSELGLRKPPVTYAELVADLGDSELDLTPDLLTPGQWEAMGVVDAEGTGFLSCCDTVAEFLTELDARHGPDSGAPPLDPSRIPPEEWPEEAGYDTPAAPPFSMIWLRARLTDAEAHTPTLLNGFLLNTVPATAAVTRLEETLGTSNGRPAQHFSLTRTPVHFDAASRAPELEVEVVEGGEARRWELVPDFFRQGPESEVFVLDPATGTLRFGDGRNGRIPVAGATVVARRYRYGGGATGNAGPGTVTKLRSALPRVDAVTNLRAAVGGADAEPLDEVKLRAPYDLRARDRAVTAEDFSHLALATPGVTLHRAYAVPRTRLAPGGALEPADGAVTVVALPANEKEATPQPSEAQLRAIADHLNARRLITTELWVTGPRYTRVERLTATLRVRSDAELKAVEEAATHALLTYFHPLRGGDEGRGWPFGGAVYLGNVYQRLLALPGVRRVVALEVRLEGTAAGPLPDRLPLEEGHLVHLPRAVIDLDVGYDPVAGSGGHG